MRSRGSPSPLTTPSQRAFPPHEADTASYPIAAPSLNVPGFGHRSPPWTAVALPGTSADEASRAPSRPPSTEQEPVKLFACPYTKYDSQRYSAFNLKELNYRGCGQCYLTDISRLKQHLYRVHERPHHFCPTCFEVFKNQGECARHIVSRSCTPQECPFAEKMTTEQLAVIKKKNRGTNPYDCWNDIYQTLFPDTPLPSSPFASFADPSTHVSLNLFMQYIQDRAPQRLRQQLSINLIMDDGIMSALERSFTSILIDLRQEFDLSMQGDQSHLSTHAPLGPAFEDDMSKKPSSRKRKATDASLQVPANFIYATDTQSLSSFGDVSAPGSFSSTPARVDDDADHYSRRQMASPAKRFVLDMEQQEGMPDLLSNQMIRVVSNERQWQPSATMSDEALSTYFASDIQKTASPQPMYHSAAEDWQMPIMTVPNLTVGTPQPAFNVTAPRQWTDEHGNPMWY